MKKCITLLGLLLILTGTIRAQNVTDGSIVKLKAFFVPVGLASDFNLGVGYEKPIFNHMSIDIKAGHIWSTSAISNVNQSFYIQGGPRYYKTKDIFQSSFFIQPEITVFKESEKKSEFHFSASGGYKQAVLDLFIIEFTGGFGFVKTPKVFEEIQNVYPKLELLLGVNLGRENKRDKSENRI